eukprot:2649293-Rhodomonas_salina.1
MSLIRRKLKHIKIQSKNRVAQRERERWNRMDGEKKRKSKKRKKREKRKKSRKRKKSKKSKKRKSKKQCSKEIEP